MAEIIDMIKQYVKIEKAIKERALEIVKRM